MEIVNRIKEQLSLAVTSQRQIDHQTAMISQKASLLRNFRMDSKKVQSKYYSFSPTTLEFLQFLKEFGRVLLRAISRLISY